MFRNSKTYSDQSSCLLATNARNFSSASILCRNSLSVYETDELDFSNYLTDVTDIILL